MSLSLQLNNYLSAVGVGACCVKRHRNAVKPLSRVMSAKRKAYVNNLTVGR